MPEFPSGPLLGAFGASVIAACSLPTATLELPNEPGQTASVAKPPPAARERKRGLDRRRPEIIHAELLTGDHLRLHFSEPLAPLEGVDPNDFRLSLGMAKSYKFYAYAYYIDLIEFVETVDGDQDRVRLSNMSGADAVIDLHLEPDLDLAYCHELLAELFDMRSEPGVHVEAGVFLHYSPGDVSVSDEAGNGLAAVGADWVQVGRRGGDEAFESYFEGPQARRVLGGLIPVECGPAPVEPISAP